MCEDAMENNDDDVHLYLYGTNFNAEDARGVGGGVARAKNWCTVLSNK